jgi:hypothetical protein
MISTTWLLALMTVAILLAYEVALLWVPRRSPGLLAFIVYPLAGPVAALSVVAALVAFDGFPG